MLSQSIGRRGTKRRSWPSMSRSPAKPLTSAIQTPPHDATWMPSPTLPARFARSIAALMRKYS